MGTQPGNNHSLAGRGRGGNDAKWSGAVSHVKLVSNAPDEDFQTGRTKAPVISTEDPQSVNILLDSRSRLDRSTTSNPFYFRCSLNSNLFRSRFMRVRKVVIPKPPNITPNNNTFIFVMGAEVSYTYVMPVGYYNTSQFSTALAGGMTANGPGAIFTCSFDGQTRTFNVSTPAANIWYFRNDCSFITRGETFAPFTSFAPATLVVGNGLLEWNSGVASLLYTRYIFVCSEALNTYSFADSRTSDVGFNEDVLAIVDLTSLYTPEDWAVGVPFAGGYETVLTDEAPNISLRNPQRNLSSEVDIYTLDEYGIDFNECFNLGASYPPNTVGISLWMEITF